MPTIMEKHQRDEVDTKMNMGKMKLETGSRRSCRSNKSEGVVRKNFLAPQNLISPHMYRRQIIWKSYFI